MIACNLIGKGGRPVDVCLLADILYAVSGEPLLSSAVAQRFGLMDDTARVLMRRFHSLGRVRIADWTLSKQGRGPMQPFYGLPNGEPDCPKPRVYERPGTKHRRPRAMRIEPGRDMLILHRLLTVLQSQSLTTDDLALTAECSYDTARRVLLHLHGRMVYVSGWTHRSICPGGAQVAMYHYGLHRRDRPAPKRQTEAERSRKTKARRDSIVAHAELNHLMAGMRDTNARLFARRRSIEFSQAA